MIDLERSKKEDNIIGCNVRNERILEELALVSDIFCDKTGTLTKNELQFRTICMGETTFWLRSNNEKHIKKFYSDVKSAFDSIACLYEDTIDGNKNTVIEPPEPQQNQNKLMLPPLAITGHRRSDARTDVSQSNVESRQERFLDFWRCMCLCHDVIQMEHHKEVLFNVEDVDEEFAIERTPKKLMVARGRSLDPDGDSDQPVKDGDSCHEKVVFSGLSLDEMAFVQMCREVGFCRFIERDNHNIRIEVNGIDEHYEILRKLEFSS